MIHSVTGKLTGTFNNFAVIECGGIGIKLFINARTRATLPPLGASTSLYSYLYVRESQMELYGFPDEATQHLFELLISISGVGPKTALGILDSESVPNLIAAIMERRPDILTHTSGVGKKTAERIILELQNKLVGQGTGEKTKTMDTNRDVEEALVELGYSRHIVREALASIPKEVISPEERIKYVLKTVGKKR